MLGALNGGEPFLPAIPALAIFVVGVRDLHGMISVIQRERGDQTDATPGTSLAGDMSEST